jgi:hypothetical protein
VCCVWLGLSSAGVRGVELNAALCGKLTKNNSDMCAAR